MKYRIHWIENHRINKDPSELTEKEEKEFLEDFPPNSKLTGSDGQWLEVEIEEVFEAKNNKEAREFIGENYDCEVWSCFPESGDCFTEED